MEKQKKEQGKWADLVRNPIIRGYLFLTIIIAISLSTKILQDSVDDLGEKNAERIQKKLPLNLGATQNGRVMILQKVFYEKSEQALTGVILVDDKNVDSDIKSPKTFNKKGMIYIIQKRYYLKKLIKKGLNLKFIFEDTEKNEIKQFIIKKEDLF